MIGVMWRTTLTGSLINEPLPCVDMGSCEASLKTKKMTAIDCEEHLHNRSNVDDILV